MIDGMKAQYDTLAQVIKEGGKNVVKNFLFKGDTGEFDLKTNMKDLETVMNTLTEVFPALEGKVDVGDAIGGIKKGATEYNEIIKLFSIEGLSKDTIV